MSTATDGIQWVVTENPSGLNWAEWKRSACMDLEGVVFAPAAIAGNEQRVFLCAAWDGNVAMILSEGHVYLPVRWLAAYSREDADLCMLVERKVKATLAKQP
jgi:hypothetical protein